MLPRGLLPTMHRVGGWRPPSRHPHEPCEQDVPLQTRPQTPQFELLVLRLTSHPSAGLLLQSAKPALQVKPQLPAEQVVTAFARAGHTLPHAPHALVFVVRSVSQPLLAVLSQLPKPAWQVKPQVPLAQLVRALALAGHTFAQAPQLLTSVAGVTHCPPQTVCPLPQTPAHWPAAQTWPVGHEVPQVPQLLGSVCVLTQRPEQADWPVGQSRTHAPFEQIWLLPQTRPQAPQLLRSAFRSRHTPLQSVKPIEHEVWHRPPAQICPEPQALPHEPQLLRSVARSRQTPLHSVVPDEHETTHAPFKQI